MTVDLLAQARIHRDGGRPGDAIATYARLLEHRQDAGVLIEAAEVALKVDPTLAEQLARLAIARAPTNGVARHHLADALAAQARWDEAAVEYRVAVAADGRLADLRHPGARPWTRVDPPRPCPACGEADAELVFAGNGTRVQTVFNQLDPIKLWVRCAGCGLVRTPTAPSDAHLAAYYAAQRGSAGGVAAPDGRAVTTECLAWEPVLERIERALGGTGTLLELGCAWGVFLAAATWRGFAARGLELSPTAAAFARERLGVPVEVAQVPDGLPDGQVDAIVLWEVIEHFPEPDRVLAALAARVRPGGIVALSTPDLDHPAHRAMGAGDPMWSVPGHLVYYD
ncbi:MAG: methyltransferase domain-containing protein, partial [Myxococcota bacterium]